MKNLKLRALQLSSKELTREQMKNVTGGGFSIIRPCFKCCPSDACSPVRHYCLDKLCPE